MAHESDIGGIITNCPLVITPPVAGKFTWLSPRNGVFVPAEPLALGQRYELKLQPGLLRADGKPAGVVLHRTLATPAFGLSATWPRNANPNALSEPEIKLVFNADVRAEEAERFLYFRDAGWQRIPADARQGTAEEMGYELGGGSAVRTWEQEFKRAKNPNSGADESAANGSPTNRVANLLIATPRSALPLGRGWKLVVGAGLATPDHSLRLREAAEVPVGDVTPFIVSGVAARNLIHSGASIRFSFSKQVPESLTNRISDWLEIIPSPTNLSVQTEWRSLVLRGALQSETAYALRLKPDFASAEGFTLAGTNTFNLRMPRIAPRLYFPALARDQLAGGNRSFPLLAVNVDQVRVRAKLLEPHAAIHALRGYGSYFATPDDRRASERWDEPYRSLDYNLVPGRTVFNEAITLVAHPDTAKTLDLAWDRLLAGRKTGVVFLDAEHVAGESPRTPPLGTQALIQLTDLGLVWKQARTGVDVFVFSHGTGRPVPGATARLFSDENVPLREALTDVNGLAHLAADTNAEWVAVQLGEDFHAAVLKQGRAWQYQFELPFTGSEEQEATRRVMMFSDRNVYRPGEEVHLEALARDWGEEGLSVPAGLTGTLDCVDARERQFFHTNAVLGASGAWSVPIRLPSTVRGAYSARLHLGTNDYSYAFQVQDFQPNAFEILLQSKPIFTAGERIAIPVSAQYLFGKALDHAQ
ncbi:MAG: MG2 domain-containing protein, partial [Verrucomicrobia bacterium]|nr:MG2 domain-containing protein [Verrucomicrobiota bacterium]